MPALTIEERSALRAAIGRLLADRSTLADVRRVMDSGEGYDAALWRELAAIGLLRLVIDEEYGGAGAGPVELEFIMEEAGAALLCAPFLSSAVLCAELLRRLNDDEASDRLLPEIAAGSVIAARPDGGPGCWTPDGVAMIASPDGEAWQLDGEAAFVIYGHSASVLLVAARSAAGIDVFEVDPGASGVSLKLLPTFDRSLRLANLTFEGAAASRIGENGRGWEASEAALNIARVGIAGEQAGAGQHVLAFTVDYARTRIQFGRLIGSFQAIEHIAADLLLESESAISAARYAAAQLAAAAPDAKAAVEPPAFACSNPHIWAVIIIGAGDQSFCAGADLKALANREPFAVSEREQAWGFAGYVEHHISKPNVAAVNGTALGGGTELALASDLAVASETATFGLPDGKLGILEAAGGAFRLAQQLPRKIAMEMMLTGEPISAPRALELGLVNAVVPQAQVLDAALKMAARITANAPLAVQASKRIALGIQQGKIAADAAAWALTRAEIGTVMRSEDGREGRRAFAEKRAPVWQGRWEFRSR